MQKNVRFCDRMLNLALALLALLAILATACNMPAAEHQDKLLARVHSKTLYLSEMDGMFPPGTTGQDSSLIIQAYVQRWIREAVLLNEAERNIPSDLNIDKLVRDYRASLIKANYEKILVEELLDSTISKEELMAFYEKNKEQYQLETPIVRCYFIKVPLKAPDQDRLRRLWNSTKSDDFSDLVKFCSRYAEAHLLEDSTWYSIEAIDAQLPPGTLTANNVGAKREFTQRDGNYQYYFRLFEMKNRKDIAPLSYIEGQARKFILHQRKLKVLEDAKEEMYEREMRRNKVEVFVQ